MSGHDHLRQGALLLLLTLFSVSAGAQTIEIVDDRGNVVTGTQTVNVGEHVRAGFTVQPAGTAFTQPQWLVTGLHLRDWVVKDGEARPMRLADYLGDEIEFVWKDTTRPSQPNVLWVSVVVGGAVISDQVEFAVERQPKAEKFYSDDLLMENHNNWHNVYSFGFGSTRRGDLFLAWHRNQLSYFNSWREFFGYPAISNWEPTEAWAVAGNVPPARQHPSIGPVPAAAFSSRSASLITLDLTDQGLTTPSAGEYDLRTAADGRGTHPEFVAAGYILRSDTVRDLICGGNPACLTDPTLARSGVVDLPSWWRPSAGQTASDPWFAAGCPARQSPTNPVTVATCVPQQKRALEDYTLRQFGESVESGRYADNFRVNYHALGHIAASEDMSNPATSMRDPIFWGWHRHIDNLLTQWQAAQGAQAQGPVTIVGEPAFDGAFQRVQVAFSHRLVADAVRPENVRVNGQPATAVQDLSPPGAGSLFEFSGFPVPADGQVEVEVRREVNNTIRTSAFLPRPRPTLIMSTFGNLLEPVVSRYHSNKP